MNEEITKIKYHIRQLAESLDFDEHPIPCLVVEFDWGEHQLSRAHDIFEKYDHLLEEGKDPLWSNLENDLKAEFGISYQAVKTIVNAFYANGQWQNVCYWFAKGQEPACPLELKHILERRRD